MKRKRDYEESTGYVFADLGFRNSKQELLKAKLTAEIYKLLKKRGVTQQLPMLEALQTGLEGKTAKQKNRRHCIAGSPGSSRGSVALPATDGSTEARFGGCSELFKSLQSVSSNPASSQENAGATIISKRCDTMIVPARILARDSNRMLDRSAYYHGAAVIPILEDSRCRSIRKLGALGYVVNDDTFLFIKYTTKERSPWRFTFDREDVARATNMAAEYRRLALGFVCGSDGVCAIDWSQGRELLGAKPGWIAASRKHNHSYNVWGANGELKRKVSLGKWPSLVFSVETTESANVA